MDDNKRKEDLLNQQIDQFIREHKNDQLSENYKPINLDELSDEELENLGMERYVTADRDLYIERGLLPPYEKTETEREIESYIRSTRDKPVSTDELPQEVIDRFTPVHFEYDPEVAERIRTRK
jgi:hypothetical protein